MWSWRSAPCRTVLISPGQTRRASGGSTSSRRCTFSKRCGAGRASPRCAGRSATATTSRWSWTTAARASPGLITRNSRRRRTPGAPSRSATRSVRRGRSWKYSGASLITAGISSRTSRPISSRSTGTSCTSSTARTSRWTGRWPCSSGAARALPCAAINPWMARDGEPPRVRTRCPPCPCRRPAARRARRCGRASRADRRAAALIPAPAARRRPGSSFPCGNQSAGASRHRRDDVPVISAARWRGGSRRSPRRFSG